LIRDLIVGAWLGVLEVFRSEHHNTAAPDPVVMPLEEIETWEQFMSYDDVSEPEQWMLFGDDPSLIALAQRWVLARQRKCEEIWEDIPKRRKLLTQGIATDLPVVGWEAFEGIDDEGYWEYDDDDPAAEPVWVKFDESWYGENE